MRSPGQSPPAVASRRGRGARRRRVVSRVVRPLRRRAAPRYQRYLDWEVVALVVGITIPVFFAFGFYNRWWRYVSTRDMWGAIRGVAVAVIAVFVVFSLLGRDIHTLKVPRGIWIVDLLLLLAFVMGSEPARAHGHRAPVRRSVVARGKEVIIVGAGDATQLILREMLRTPALGYTPIGLVDDDPRKKNLRLHGIRVLGTSEELQAFSATEARRAAHRDPFRRGEARERIVAMARGEGVPVKTLPGLAEMISTDFNLTGQIRPVEVEDLLGREPVEVDSTRSPAT